MDFLIGVLAGLFVAVLLLLLPGDAWLTKRWIEAAVERSPAGLRTRLREEWMAGLDDGPGGIWKLAWTIDLMQAAKSIEPMSKPVEKRKIVDIQVEDGTEVRIKRRPVQIDG